MVANGITSSVVFSVCFSVLYKIADQLPLWSGVTDNLIAWFTHVRKN